MGDSVRIPNQRKYMKNNSGLAPVHGCWKYGKCGPYLTITSSEIHEKRFYLHCTVLDSNLILSHLNALAVPIGPIRLPNRPITTLFGSQNTVELFVRRVC